MWTVGLNPKVLISSSIVILAQTYLPYWMCSSSGIRSWRSGSWWRIERARSCRMFQSALEFYFHKRSPIKVLNNKELSRWTFTDRQQSCGKVMFSVVCPSVCLFMEGLHLTATPWCHWSVTGHMGAPPVQTNYSHGDLTIPLRPVQTCSLAHPPPKPCASTCSNLFTM